MAINTVVKDQEYFFNINAETKKETLNSPIFFDYVNKEQIRGFKWIEKSYVILEYGCGTGTSLDLFFKSRNLKDYRVIGVDIAEQAINQAKKNYPSFTFYTILENKMPEIPNESVDAAFLYHVLHHSTDHEGIFKEIYSKLKFGGKFLINDLSSDNPFINIGRFVFSKTSFIFKNKFKDDLVVDGRIPDKYKVDVDFVIKQLESAGFTVQNYYTGHLFFFLFGWLDKFIPLSKIMFIRSFYKFLIAIEQRLLSLSFFKKRAEVFCIECVKKG